MKTVYVIEKFGNLNRAKKLVDFLRKQKIKADIIKEYLWTPLSFETSPVYTVVVFKKSDYVRGKKIYYKIGSQLRPSYL